MGRRAALISARRQAGDGRRRQGGWANGGVVGVSGGRDIGGVAAGDQAYRGGDVIGMVAVVARGWQAASSARQASAEKGERRKTLMAPARHIVSLRRSAWWRGIAPPRVAWGRRSRACTTRTVCISPACVNISL